MSIVMQINPFDYFSDQQGSALDEGYIWIGERNKNPKSYPVPIFFDAALTIPAAQPLRTNAGYIVRGNSPTFLYISGNYSVLVEDKNHLQVYYIPDMLLIGSDSAVSGTDLANNVDPAKGAGLVGYRGRTVHERLSDYLSIKDFGALGNGTTDDSLAFTNAAAANLPIYFPPGTYLASGAIFPKHVEMLDGAVIKGSGTSVFQFDGGFSAPVSKVFDFSGTAKATFNFQKTYQGYSEWWGAKTEDANFDCSPAMNAALVALREVGLMPVRYFTAAAVKMQLDHRRLFGAGKSWTSQGGSQIVSNSASATIVKMGLDSNPGAVNSNLQQLRLESLTLNRNVTLLDSTSACYGVDASWILFGHIQDVESINSKVGFFSSGDVQLFKTRCYAFRHLEGTVPASDSFYGYLYNGNSGLPLAGGNASMYDRDCTANCALTVAQVPVNIGFALDNKPADYFSNGCEVTACRQGLFIQGSGTVAGDADIRIDDFKADGIGLDAIFITSIQGAINITNSYGAPSGSATSFTGLRVINSSGVSEDNNQWICWPAANSCGILFSGVTSCNIGEKTMIRDAMRPVEVHASVACRVKPSIRNTLVNATQAAVFIDQGSNRCDFGVSLSGDIAGRFPAAYGCPDATPTYNKFDWTAVMVTPLAGSNAGNRLIYNGSLLGTTVGALPNGNFSVGQPA